MFHNGGGHAMWQFMRGDDPADRPNFSRAILKRVGAYARPYLGRIGLMLLTVLAVTGVSLVPPLLMRDLIDHALPQKDGGRLNLLAAGMVAVPLVNGLLGLGQRYLGSQIGEGIIADLRSAVYAHLQRMSLRFFTDTKTGELMSRLNNDVVGAQGAINGVIVSTISNVIALAGAAAIMLSLEWRLTLVALIVLPLFVLPGRRGAVLLRGVIRQQMQLNAQMNALANETLNVSGALLVKLFGRTDAESGRYRERAEAVRDVGVRQSLIGQGLGLALALASALGTALVFWLGGQLVLRGELTIGTIVAFGAYLGQMYGPIASLSNTRVQLASALVSFERVFEVLDLPIEIAQKPGARAPERLEGRVEFQDVSFTYQPGDAPALREARRRRDHAEVAGSLSGELAEDRRKRLADRNGTPADDAPETRWALHDVSFTIEPGQLTALVGRSGAGKTTTTYLLPRLYDPTGGRILLDGVDLRDLPLRTLSDNIGMVTQETYLFHDTIRTNLLYANPRASQDEIEEACRVANIHNFIADLPEGYDTIVGERGYRLSGGEKQRVAIARVVLKNPRILVLDEATSHLDSQSEALIQDALERVMAGRTSLVIAHRLSTILKANQILVLDKGRLAERGTHAELVEQEGLYSKLYQTQFRHARPGAILRPAITP
jgi:ATP-binding cassette subfamily B protein